MKSDIVIQVTSLSNASLGEYPDNSLTRFTHVLPEAIKIPPGLIARAGLRTLTMKHTLQAEFREKRVGYIKVHLKELAPILNKVEDCQVLARLPFKRDELAWVHPDSTEYHALAAAKEIRELNFLLTDERNEQLKLARGPATVIQLEIVMSPNTKSFSLSLDMNLSKSLFTDNTQVRWRTELPQSFNVDPSWEVCLHSLQVPRAVTFPAAQFKIIMHRASQSYFGDNEFSEEPGRDSVFERNMFTENNATERAFLTGEVAEFFAKHSQVLTLDEEGEIRFTYYDMNELDLMKAQIYDTELDFFNSMTLPPRTCEMLGLRYSDRRGLNFVLPGFDESKVLRPGRLGYNPDMEILAGPRVDHLAIYCDAAASSVVGNVNGPIMDIISTRALGLFNLQEETFYSVKQPIFRAVNPNMKKTFEVRLVTLDGREPPIAYAEDSKEEEKIPLSLTLVFRKPN